MKSGSSASLSCCLINASPDVPAVDEYTGENVGPNIDLNSKVSVLRGGEGAPRAFAC